MVAETQSALTEARRAVLISLHKKASVWALAGGLFAAQEAAIAMKDTTHVANLQILNGGAQ